MRKYLFLLFFMGIESLYSLPNTSIGIVKFKSKSFQYEIDFNKPLGNGAYGAVYEATRKKISSCNEVIRKNILSCNNEGMIEREKKVAIKIMEPDNEYRMSRCEDEVRFNERFDHPNIMKYYETFSFEDKIFLVLKLLKGNTLQAAIDKKQKFSEERACNVFRQLVLAMEHLDEKNVIHRDIKPANIFIDDNEKVFLFDFGLSVDINAVWYQRSIMGTPLYLAPDLFHRALNKHMKFPAITVDELRAGDIYSLGVTLLEILEGKDLMELLNIKTINNFINHRILHENKEMSSDDIFHELKSPQLQKEILQLIHPDPTKRPSISTIKETFSCFHPSNK